LGGFGELGLRGELELVMSQKSFLVLVALILLPAAWPVPSPGAGPEPRAEAAGNPGLQGEPTQKDTPNYQDYALLIAGLKGRQGPLSLEEGKPSWVNHARVMNQSWANFEKRQLSAMREWAARELTPAEGHPVFYPFSGPDFVNMFTLFPRAPTYIMVSLEPVGNLPDFGKAGGDNFFPSLQRSLYDLLQLTFFITPKLRASLGTRDLKGVLPVLLFFMAREGLQVREVNYWVMNSEGTVAETPATAAPTAAAAGDIPGLRLVFKRPGAAETQTLYYVRFNLHNNSFERNQQLVSFLEKFAPFTTFSKAASYLMHKPYFSAVRRFILEKSAAVLQSDSAIPLHYFDRAVWDLRFYGTYKGPIALFSNCYQKDLAEIYHKGQDIRPLPFGICYRHRPRTSNLMFAIKRPGWPPTVPAEIKI